MAAAIRRHGTFQAHGRRGLARSDDLSPMWNKILHQEEDLHQYVLQKLLHEAGPEHQSVGRVYEGAAVITEVASSDE